MKIFGVTVSNIVRFFKTLVFEISTSGGEQLSISAFNFLYFPLIISESNERFGESAYMNYWAI
jgi:hypothetical protein